MIHFVGAGPGAPDLITLRGASLLRTADVVVYAGSLVNPELLQLADPDCEVYDSSRMTLEQVLDVMVQATAAKRDVVRLHTGDPSLYGAIREQMDELERRGIPYDNIPGVSSFCAAAASLGAEYTLPGVSQSVIVTRLAGRTPVPESEQLSALAAHGASMAIFLSAGMLPQVQEELLRGGCDGSTPAAIVYKASWPDERVVRTCVGRLAHDGAAARITKTALILVGDFLGACGERSRLYDPSFSTGLREASTPPQRKGVAVISFSERGQALAERLAQELGGVAQRCEQGGLARWTAKNFERCEALVFVGATGIAVRAIASHVQSKAADPAVVVVDEQGQFAVPVLSGHLGGANDLARSIERACGARAVITTATDGRGAFAVDEWARHQGCVVTNPERIRRVSVAVLAGDTIRVFSDWPLPANPPHGVAPTSLPDSCDVLLSTRTCRDDLPLRVVPRVLALGVGCRKGVTADVLLARYHDFMARAGYDERALMCVCSVDAKATEPGIVELCEVLGVPFVTFSAKELAAVPGTFASSDFVRDAVGVDNVCERSAVLGSDGGVLVCAKQAAEGITMALACADFEPTWRWSCE